MIVQTLPTVITTLSGPVCIWNALKSKRSPFIWVSLIMYLTQKEGESNVFPLLAVSQSGSSSVWHIYRRGFRHLRELTQLLFRFQTVWIYRVAVALTFAHQIKVECQMFHYRTSKMALRGRTNIEYVHFKCQVSLTPQPFISNLWRYNLDWSLICDRHRFPPHDN